MWICKEKTLSTCVVTENGNVTSDNTISTCEFIYLNENDKKSITITFDIPDSESESEPESELEPKADNDSNIEAIFAENPEILKYELVSQIHNKKMSELMFVVKIFNKSCGAVLYTSGMPCYYYDIENFSIEDNRINLNLKELGSGMLF